LFLLLFSLLNYKGIMTIQSYSFYVKPYLRLEFYAGF
jgi:hypothetical protein